MKDYDVEVYDLDAINDNLVIEDEEDLSPNKVELKDSNGEFASGDSSSDDNY
jgi:hypothetical protein